MRHTQPRMHARFSYGDSKQTQHTYCAHAHKTPGTSSYPCTGREHAHSTQKQRAHARPRPVQKLLHQHPPPSTHTTPPPSQILRALVSRESCRHHTTAAAMIIIHPSLHRHQHQQQPVRAHQQHQCIEREKSTKVVVLSCTHQQVFSVRQTDTQGVRKTLLEPRHPVLCCRRWRQTAQHREHLSLPASCAYTALVCSHQGHARQPQGTHTHTQCTHPTPTHTPHAQPDNCKYRSAERAQQHPESKQQTHLAAACRRELHERWYIDRYSCCLSPVSEPCAHTTQSL